MEEGGKDIRQANRKCDEQVSVQVKEPRDTARFTCLLEVKLVVWI